jgi:hypothetical protein
VYAGTLPTAEVQAEDVPGLDTLSAWLTELSPVNVVDDAPDVLRLDQAGLTVDPDAKVDVDALAERLRGSAAVAGSVLGTADGARAVLRSGVSTVVRLPGQHTAALLLRLAQAAEQESESQARPSGP